MNKALPRSSTSGATASWNRFRERIDVEPVKRCELKEAYDAISARIDGVAEYEVFLEAIERSIATVWRMTLSGSRGTPGYMIVLPITRDGEELLLAGELDTRRPGAHVIATRADQISAVYLWALCGPPLTFPGGLNVLDRYSTEEFQGISVYCRPVSDDVRGVFKKTGFEDFTTAKGDRLMRMARPKLVQPARPTEGAELRIDVCRTLNDLHRVFAIRAMTYMAEQDCPFDEEFDGNDLCATQLIGYVEGEPVSCVRLRYFGDFVKVERLAVVKKHRGTDVACETARAAVEFGRRKGFTKFYGHSTDRVAPLWQEVGFRHVVASEAFEFSGASYREMVLETERHAEALTTRSGALCLIRPEGEWDRPGVLENVNDAGVTKLGDAA